MITQKNKTFELTEKEVKQIIDYIRFEARLSYNLKRMLWLSTEKVRILNETKSLSERFKFKKSDLKRLNKEIYNYIVGKDEVETGFNKVRLKDILKDLKGGKNEVKKDD